MTTSWDRTVHARYPGTEIVRYDRAGKWYMEYTDEAAIWPKRREHLTLAQAVQVARRAPNNGGEILFGRPGGQAFDRKVRAASWRPT